MKFFKWRLVSILVLFCSCILISTSDVYAACGEVAFAQYDALVEKASDEGSVKVIVRLVVPDLQEKTEASRSFGVISPGQVFSSDALQADLVLAKAIHTTADSVVQALDPNEYEINHTYSTVPLLALNASAKSLSTLRSLPSVANIVEDRPMELTEMNAVNNVSADDTAVSDNLKVIGADVAWSKGYTGSGWYVAILDSGIRATHEMFKGKAIVEACFSASADCPNKEKEMTGSGGRGPLL